MSILWRKPLKQGLLKALNWLERTGEHQKPPRAKSFFSFLRADIHVPTYLVVAFCGAALLTVLSLTMGFTWTSFGSYLILVGLLLAGCTLYVRKSLPKIARDDDAVMLSGVVSVFFIWFMAAFRSIDASLWNVPLSYGTPLAAAGMLLSILLVPRLALAINTLLAVMLGLLNNFSFPHFFLSAFAGAAGVAATMNVRHRSDIVRAGLWVAAGHLLASWSLFWFPGQTASSSSPSWFLGHFVLAIFDGGLSAAITLAFLPYLESFFSRVSNIKLLELADFNSPLLKRLMVEAPGTYHHSLIVAALAEQAAQAVGANGLLCRVGAYYHDVGKMLHPEYFIENQGALGTTNAHDKLAPSMSRIVIMSHVKDGVALARQYGVDQTLIDFIPMHHGTTCVEYFYNRAVEQSEGETADEEEYRYSGPRPYSKETAIVMMADSVEATSRVLENPTHSRLKTLVAKIVNNKFSDGQFDECPITLADLRAISDTFVTTLSSIHHSRIEYPERKDPKHAEEGASRKSTS